MVLKNKKENNSKTTIWITGTRGFIGEHILKTFQDHKYNILQISNCLTSSELFINKKILKINLLDKKNIEKIIQIYGIPDKFIHLGWGDTSNPHSIEHTTSNVICSKNLIDVLFNSGLKKFIFLGSMNEYGERVNSLNENMNSKGVLTKYAVGKKNVAKYGFKIAKQLNVIFVHIRLFYVYGDGQKKTSLINTLYSNFIKNTKVSLGSCEYYRDYIHIDEAIKGIKLLSELNSSNTVNLGSGNAIKLKDFVIEFWKQLGGEKKLLHFGDMSFYKNEQKQNYAYANLDKLKNITHWEPKFTIKKGIRLTIKELKKNS